MLPSTAWFCVCIKRHGRSLKSSAILCIYDILRLERTVFKSLVKKKKYIYMQIFLQNAILYRIVYHPVA